MSFQIPSCFRQSVILLALLLLALSGSSSPATPLRVATLNVELGLGAPGSAGFEAVLDILERIDADVVALQELNRPDLEGAPTPLESLSSTLGYPHVHIATTQRVLDSGMRAGFLSRYPITSAINIVPPPAARDMVRQIPAIVVDIPATVADPTILTLHLKCCLDPDDPFRRAVELKRARDHLASRGLTAQDNVIVLGDFNLIGNDLVFEAIPGGLPTTFDLGEDITFPVNYHIDPAAYFQSWSMSALEARQLNGSSSTQGSSRLDFILVTSALTDRIHASEIYNSALDVSNRDGLSKSGSPLPERTSGNASDHLAIFADFELTSRDALVLQVSPAEVAESDPPGTAVLTIELPSAPGPGESIEVLLSSSAPEEAIPAETTVTFQPGETSRNINVVPRTDGRIDGSQEVIFTASSTGFAPATTRLMVNDSSISLYEISQLGEAASEDFIGFDGFSDPLRWTTSRGHWRGPDDGSSGITGLYSYGNDGSLGFLININPVTATASFRNATGHTITALKVAYDAEQWRAFEGGRADTITVEASIGGKLTPLPALTFTADHSPGSNGRVPDGRSISLKMDLPALSIASGETFQLKFTANPGLPPGFMEQSVRLNEIHYDNDGQDTGEFLEILVAPGYEGLIPEVEIFLYNGNGGRVYGQHSLASFSLDQTLPSGHRLYSKLIPRIQNGPDGVAIVAGGEVREFLSYEGTLTATDGPAIRSTSENMGVSQANPVPPSGTGSLGLDELSAWSRFSTPHSRGSLNPGQLLIPHPLPGIAIDNIRIVALNDADLDGLPDPLEEELGTNPRLADSDEDGILDGDEDTDGDHQSNLAEFSLTQTDPLDPNSHFQIVVTSDPGVSHGALVSFPSLTNRNYTVFRSHDLITWTPLLSLSGSGRFETRAVTGEPLAPANFFRVEIVRSR